MNGVHEIKITLSNVCYTCCAQVSCHLILGF